MKKNKDKIHNTKCFYCKDKKIRKINNRYICKDCNKGILLLQKFKYLKRNQAEKEYAKIWKVRYRKPKKEKNKRLPKDFNYKNYLKSNHWLSVRKRFYSSKYFKGCCFCCESTDNLQVHHKTYKNIFNENDKDLVCLCRDCHNTVHKIIKFIKTNNIKDYGYTLMKCHGKLRHKLNKYKSLEKAYDTVIKELRL